LALPTLQASFAAYQLPHGRPLLPTHFFGDPEKASQSLRDFYRQILPLIPQTNNLPSLVAILRGVPETELRQLAVDKAIIRWGSHVAFDPRDQQEWLFDYLLRVVAYNKATLKTHTEILPGLKVDLYYNVVKASARSYLESHIAALTPPLTEPPITNSS
jgi:hypothetical protein